MQFQPPLSTLIDRCQTICVAECCGIDAYDFSPIQIASYLTMYQGRPQDAEIASLRQQIQALKSTCGSQACGASHTTFEEMNQLLTGDKVDDLVDELLANIDVALKLIQQSESLRYRCV